MSQIVLSKGLRLPAEVVTQTIGILGRRGSGKTTTASVLVEELLRAKLPFVIIDPTDAWWGLKASKDGKDEGFPVTVLGGDHADEVLEETAGKIVADLVAEAAPPLVLSLSALSGAAQRRFVRDFCERLYEKNRTALHVVIDEADEFVPQRLFRDALAVFGAVDKLVRRGRKNGIGVTLISQRSAAINKDVLSQCEVLIAHRASHPTDIEPVLKWMEVHARSRTEEVHGSIAHLADGEAWVMSPEWLGVFARVQMNDRTTFNSSATPKPGVRLVEPKKLAKPDLAVLRARMRDSIERARANDPNALRTRIAELERAAAEKAPPPPPEVRTVEVPALPAADLAHLDKLADRLIVAQDRLAQAQQVVATELGNLSSRVLSLKTALQGAPRNGAPIPPARPPPAPRLVASRLGTRRERAAESEEAGELKKGQRVMVAALAGAGGSLDRQTLAVWSCMRQSGTFTDYLSNLHTRGLVEKGEDGREHLTEAGRASGISPWRPTPGEIVAAWKERHLKGGQGAMLDALMRFAGEGGLARPALAAEVEMAESGTFTDYLSFLRTSGLVEKRDGREALSRSVLG